MSRWVAGLDGCKAGWLCVLFDINGKAPPRVRLLTAFAQIFSLPESPAKIAVDIPIGLPERAIIGGRLCCNALRRHLGDRQSAVFAVPARMAVMQTDYVRACEIALKFSDPPRRVSKQCFNLFPKIREVDAAMTPALQERVHESHPEGAFWAMNGKQALDKPKKIKSRPYPPGLELRRSLLADTGFPLEFLGQTAFRRIQAGEDDFLDACACAWTASRIAKGEAVRFPEGDQPLDVRGLRMEIWA